MGALFIAVAAVCVADAGHAAITVLAAVGSALAIVRTLFQLALAKIFGRPDLDEASAARAERIFGAIYLLFAAVLGLFAAVALHYCPAEERMVITALVVGFAAGVAASIALRPWIAIPALLLSVTPIIVSAAAVGGIAHSMLALLLTALMTGAIGSMLHRYRTAVEMIAMRQLFASLARKDPLTGLANRFALEDRFLEAVSTCGGRQVVIHCLDLDRFKPINDAYGHAIGDLVLTAVGGRLVRLLRSGDLAIRLGGDEFAVLQTGVLHADEAELMTRRIARALTEPYAIEGHDIKIGVSIGSASGREHGPVLADLLTVADTELYAVKRGTSPGRALAG